MEFQLILVRALVLGNELVWRRFLQVCIGSSGSGISGIIEFILAMWMVWAPSRGQLNECKRCGWSECILLGIPLQPPQQMCYQCILLWIVMLIISSCPPPFAVLLLRRLLALTHCMDMESANGLVVKPSVRTWDNLSSRWHPSLAVPVSLTSCLLLYCSSQIEKRKTFTKTVAVYAGKTIRSFCFYLCRALRHFSKTEEQWFGRFGGILVVQKIDLLSAEQVADNFCPHPFPPLLHNWSWDIWHS